MQAIRTEYNGTVYDSKSEAVFARTLHLLGHKFLYHPPSRCDHEWDFLVFREPWKHNRGSYVFEHDMGYEEIENIDDFVSYKPILVEYKPSAPTDTYIENLTRMMANKPFESVIVWGSPWKGVINYGSPRLSYACYPIFCSHDSKYGWGDFIQLGDNGESIPVSSRHMFGKVFQCQDDEIIQQAKQYRFDLRN
jgi:hypothetical protein